MIAMLVKYSTLDAGVCVREKVILVPDDMHIGKLLSVARRHSVDMCSPTPIEIRLFKTEMEG